MEKRISPESTSKTNQEKVNTKKFWPMARITISVSGTIANSTRRFNSWPDMHLNHTSVGIWLFCSLNGLYFFQMYMYICFPGLFLLVFQGSSGFLKLINLNLQSVFISNGFSNSCFCSRLFWTVQPFAYTTVFCI